MLKPKVVGDCIIEIDHFDQVLKSAPMPYTKAIKELRKFTRRGIAARLRQTAFQKQETP